MKPVLVLVSALLLAACGSAAERSPEPVTVTVSTPAAGTVAASGLTSKLYDDLMSQTDATLSLLAKSGGAQGTCLAVSLKVGDTAACSADIETASTEAETYLEVGLATLGDAINHSQGQCRSSLSDLAQGFRAYLQALTDWAAEAALGEPTGNGYDAVTRVRDDQLPAARDEVASSCSPA